MERAGLIKMDVDRETRPRLFGDYPICRPDDPTPPDLTRSQQPSTEPNQKPITLREPCASRRSTLVFSFGAERVPFPAPSGR